MVASRIFPLNLLLPSMIMKKVADVAPPKMP